MILLLLLLIFGVGVNSKHERISEFCNHENTKYTK